MLRVRRGGPACPQNSAVTESGVQTQMIPGRLRTKPENPRLNPGSYRLEPVCMRMERVSMGLKAVNPRLHRGSDRL